MADRAARLSWLRGERRLAKGRVRLLWRPSLLRRSEKKMLPREGLVRFAAVWERLRVRDERQRWKGLVRGEEENLQRDWGLWVLLPYCRDPKNGSNLPPLCKAGNEKK
uniref:Uncharacterized protein n=1 Tax=Populus alba TaxID=43335 RepID=A0A4U5QXV9_POPAL|nr:hypothetical protein D5086_0000028360 [Populus alba]